MAEKRWIAETLFDDLGFRMSFRVDKVLYELQTEHQHLVLFEQPFFGKMLMLDGAPQRCLDVLDVIEPLCAVQIDDQVHAGTADAVANREVIVAILRQRRRGHCEFGLPVFLSGGTWDPQALPRSQEGVLAHAVLPNQR